MNEKKEKIDVVYTWVTFNQKLKKEINELKGEHSNDNSDPHRYIDNDELKYSLRSLERNANWVHKIYIVVHDGQRPLWLKETPRLKIIKHSDIIPKKYLPTYNSLCIESFLYKIPNLTEKYIYFNDDLLLWNKVRPGNFFTKNKTRETSAISYFDYNKNHFFPVGFTQHNDILVNNDKYHFEKLIIFNSNLISKYLNQPLENIHSVEHVPFGNFKSWNEKLDIFLNKIRYKNTNLNEYTKMSKFRENINIAQVSIFRKYWYNKHNLTSTSNSKVYYLTIQRMNKKVVDELLRSKVHFVCIQNDIDYLKEENEKSYQINQMNVLLETKFPFPSSFEI